MQSTTAKDSLEILSRGDSPSILLANEFVDSVMRPDEELSMASDFPLLLGIDAPTTRVVMMRDGAIVAHAASRDLDVQCGSGSTLRLVNIGAVCTSAECRGEGLASELIKTLLEKGLARGADHAILWSWTPEFWKRQGFKPVGRESIFLLDASQITGEPEVEWSELLPGDLPRLFQLRMQHGPHVNRSEDEAATLFKLPSSNTYVARQGNRPTAYLVLGKGVDYDGAVAEWAGPFSTVLQLAQVAMTKERRSQIIFVGPESHREYTRTLRSLGCSEGTQPAAWICPLHGSSWPDIYIWGLDSN